MKKVYAFPFYVKFAIILFILIASTAILYVGQDVLAPLLLALIFSILIEPISRFLQTKLKFSNTIATSIAVFIFILLIINGYTFAQVSYEDGRPQASLRLEAKDYGMIDEILTKNEK